MRGSVLLISVLCQISIILAAHIPRPHVCVIGAGIGGLSMARYLKEEGITFTVLEATKYVGGTWRYDSRVGTDENGLPMYTSMYKNLRTNLPKPTMELRGYPLPPDLRSFPSQKLYYNYLKSYAKHFDLERHIKFLHNVISVKRIDKTWKVKHKHVITGLEYEQDYDYVVVANGHHSKPHLPNIPGEELFKGTIIHSHDYKVPDPYTSRRVLLIGAGPSGLDIGLELCNVSKRLIHSHHSIVEFKTRFPPNYVRKQDVMEFNETGVIFKDGTFEEIDNVIYCTGFEYDFPFLDESCGLQLKKHSVVPLYKHMININQPTMILLGLVVRACVVIALDAQARYTTALIKGNFTLPSQEDMMAEWQKHSDTIQSMGRPPSHIHYLAEKEDAYYAELTKQSGIDRVPPVMFKIRVFDTEAKIEDLYTYRNYAYKVLDNETFVRTLEE